MTLEIAGARWAGRSYFANCRSAGIFTRNDLSGLQRIGLEKKRGGMSFSGSGVEEKWLERRWRPEETTERRRRVSRRMDGFRWECLNFVEEKNENTGPSRLESAVEAFS